MIKYQLIVLFTAPIIVAAIARSILNFRRGNISQKKLIVWMCLWIFLLLGVVFAAPAIDLLTRHELTDTTPLSDFDVVLSIGFILSLYLIFHLYSKIDLLNRSLMKMNEEWTIQIALAKQTNKSRPSVKTMAGNKNDTYKQK